MERDPSVFALLLPYLFHRGLLLAVRDENEPSGFFPLVVLDVNWIFSTVMGAFFDIPGQEHPLSQAVRSKRGGDAPRGCVSFASKRTRARPLMPGCASSLCATQLPGRGVVFAPEGSTAVGP